MRLTQGRYAFLPLRLFPAVRDSDLPFAQDCMGDQFVLRGGVVHRLSGETGELASMHMGWTEFFEQLTANPFDFLQLHPLVQFQREGGHLQPGQLLNAYPPFSAEGSGSGVSLSAVPIDQRMHFLAKLSRLLSGVPSGQKYRITVSK